MKSLLFALLIFLPFNLVSQDFWEELELPSDLPVFGYTTDSDGSIYAYGLGIYKKEVGGEWQSMNNLTLNINNTILNMQLEEIGSPMNEVLILEDKTLITSDLEGLIFISTDDGENWNNVPEDLSRIYLNTLYNNRPYFISREGVYTLNENLDSLVQITDISSSVYINGAGMTGNNFYIKTNDQDTQDDFIYIFNLEQEMITDTIDLVSFELSGEHFEGEYFESETNSYLLRYDTLFVMNKPLRKGVEFETKIIDLVPLLEIEYEQFQTSVVREMKILEDGKVLITNRQYGNFILSDADFNDYEVHILGGLDLEVVEDIRTVDEDYYVCTQIGLYKAIGKDFKNIEHLSGKMGTGIYNNVFEKNGTYYPIINKFIFSVVDGSLTHLHTSEERVERWGQSLYYTNNDSIHITKNFGVSWERIYLPNSDDMEFQVQVDGELSTYDENKIYFFDNNTLNKYSIDVPVSSGSNVGVKGVVKEKDEIYIITEIGTYKYQKDLKEWERVNSYVYSEIYPSFYDIKFFFIKDILISTNSQFISFSDDFGKTTREKIIPFNRTETYIRFADTLYYLSAGDEFRQDNFCKLTIDENKEIIIDTISNNFSPELFTSLTPTPDNRLIASNLNGNFISKNQLVTNVETENNTSTSDLIIYPNIAENEITIVTSDICAGLKVFNLNGIEKEITFEKFGQNNYKVNVSSLPIGMYLISDENGNGGFFVKK